MKVIFNNVTITVEAESPQEAHALLCETVCVSDKIEFSTDTFDTQGADGDFDNYRCTSEIVSNV